MKHVCSSFLLLLFVSAGLSQKLSTYSDSLGAFRNDYINTHEVVTAKEDRGLLRFFPIDPSYQVKCRFEKIFDAPWFPVATTTASPQMMRKYGYLSFTFHDTAVHIYVYQMQALLQKLGDYLFLPFTDLTTGTDTYGGGRYVDCNISDIHDSTLIVDFNKAYNPYCAYVSGYSCPIPPKENAMPIAIRSGEKNYGRSPH